MKTEKKNFRTPIKHNFYTIFLQFLNYVRHRSLINNEQSNKPSTPTKSYLFIEKRSINQSDSNLTEVNNFINYMKSFVTEENFRLNCFWKAME